MKFALIILAIITTVSAVSAKNKVKVWTEPAKAEAEHPKFKYIGEYSDNDEKIFHQVSVLRTQDYLVTTYQGGFPGRGWDQSDVNSRVLIQEKLDDLLKNTKKVNYVSPTMGAVAPAGAVTMPDSFTNVKDGLLWAGGKTKDEFGSFQMHIEFCLPFKPSRNPSNQDKGNSGIYIFNNYEIQVLDSFALDYTADTFPIKLESQKIQWCGCFYKLQMANVNATLPALVWQTYDVDFTAPVFEGGEKVKNARVTVLHNGIKIHDDLELKKGTGAGSVRKQLARGSIYFQNHGNPVAYRNVWIKETISNK